MFQQLWSLKPATSSAPTYPDSPSQVFLMPANLKMNNDQSHHHCNQSTLFKPLFIYASL